MDEVQRRVCKADYAQSHMFVRDWQTHCMLGWLHDSIWSQQVPPHTLLGVQVRAATYVVLTVMFKSFQML